MYREKQRFTQWWLWTILIGLALVSLFGVYWQVILEKPFGNNPMSDTGLIIFALCMVALPMFFLYVRLETDIDEKRIEMNYFPFLRKKIIWENVESARVVNYGTVGGWGIKHSPDHGTVYATGGDHGLAIKLKSGRKFVIGTQKKDELEAFLQKVSKVDS